MGTTRICQFRSSYSHWKFRKKAKIRPSTNRLKRPAVNFINILHTNFSYERRFFTFVEIEKKAVEKTFVQIMRAKKRWWNWHLGDWPGKEYPRKTFEQTNVKHFLLLKTWIHWKTSIWKVHSQNLQTSYF
jgi:hypothetical protein